MSNSKTASLDTQRVLEIIIRLGMVAILLIWGFQIIRPFITLLAWAAIIAIALHPLCQLLAGWLGQRKKLAATLITAALITLIILPAVPIINATVESGKAVAAEWHNGTINLPAPTEKVKSWPLVGEKIYATWLLASQNLESAARQFSGELKTIGATVLSAITSTGVTVLRFTASILLAGVFLAKADVISNFFHAFSGRLVGADGARYIALATATIRSVAQGVLGVAAIQTIAATIGLIVMDIPLAALWAFGVLMLAIMQLPPLLVLGPIIVYAFSVHAATPATIFAIYCIIISLSDGFLKPLLLGRGLAVPMLVILLGAIGGMILSGIIGLFVGAVVLALIYQLFVAWLHDNTTATATQESPAAP